MNCQDISLAMDDRDIGASGEPERRDFDAHLATCPDCARDWEIHTRLAATPTPPLPADLLSRIRMSSPVPAKVGGRRTSSGLVIIGAVVVLAAAAAMLAVHSMRTPAPAAAPVAKLEAPAALPAPLPAPESIESVAIAAPVVARPEQPRATEEESPFVQPRPVVKLRTVRVLPLQNQATGTAFTAVETFFVAFLDDLRANHGLVVIAPDQAEPAATAPAERQLRVRGFGPLPEGKFKAEVSLEDLQSDGSYKLELVASPTGEIAAACADSPPFDTMESCRSPAHMAGAQVRFLLSGLLPPDPSLQRDPQARLLDQSLSTNSRLGALLELGNRRSEPRQYPRRH